MGIKLADVITQGLLDEDVIACLPRVCECGAETELTPNLKQIYCSNSRCTYKIAARLESMAKEMKADGWGESACAELCRFYKMISPYQVFIIPQLIASGKAYPDIPALDKKLAEICDIDKRRMELWQVIKLGNIPGVATVASKIFGGYSSLSEAYADIERYEVPFIADKLGLQSADASVLAVKIYNTLMEYKKELEWAVGQFEIISRTGEKINIAITRSVAGYRNKSEFVDELNRVCEGKAHFIFANSVTSTTDVLIAEGDMSSKYESAIRINRKMAESGVTGRFSEEKILITTGREMLAIAKEQFGV